MKNPLIDAEPGPEAALLARTAELSLIPVPSERMAAVFLGSPDCANVVARHTRLEADLLLECLPGFVHHIGGHIVTAKRFTHETQTNPFMRTIRVDGRSRTILRDGVLLIHSPHERAVIEADYVPHFEDQDHVYIGVRSTADAADFLARWKQWGSEHNYLRGQAFFADGEIIEREHAYGWADIFLPDKTRRILRLHVESFLQNRGRLKSLGVKARRGLILAGPPGTGKTLAGKVLADTLAGVSFLWVTPRHLRSTCSFDSILTLARFVAPTVLFLEDLDLFAEDREYYQSWSSGLGELMNQLDGAVDNHDIVTIATTNRLDVIERALRNRPGRFDRVICFGALDEACRRKLLTRLLAHTQIAPDDLDFLVEATEDYTGAQITEVVNTMLMVAVDAEPAPGRPDGVPVQVDFKAIEAALDEVCPEKRSKVGFQVA